MIIKPCLLRLDKKIINPSFRRHLRITSEDTTHYLEEDEFVKIY